MAKKLKKTQRHFIKDKPFSDLAKRTVAIHRRVIYKALHNFVLNVEDDGTLTVRIRASVIYPPTNEMIWVSGSRVPLRPDYDDSRILQSFWQAVVLFEEHEAMEHFMLDHTRVFNPHPEVPPKKA